jgi:hypothetical protein
MIFYAGDKVTVNGKTGFTNIHPSPRTGYHVVEDTHGDAWSVVDCEPDLSDMRSRTFQRTLQAGMSVAYMHQQNNRKLQ